MEARGKAVDLAAGFLLGRLPLYWDEIFGSQVEVSNRGSAYIGTGAHNGEVRVLMHTQRWTGPSPTAFSTWGNFMKIVYDAP